MMWKYEMMWKSFDYKREIFCCVFKETEAEEGWSSSARKRRAVTERNRAKQGNVTGETFISPVPVWS